MIQYQDQTLIDDAGDEYTVVGWDISVETEIVLGNL